MVKCIVGVCIVRKKKSLLVWDGGLFRPVEKKIVGESAIAALAIFFIIGALAADELGNREDAAGITTKFGYSQQCIGDAACEAYSDACDSGTDEAACSLITPGQVWLAFNIIALLLFLVGLFMLFLESFRDSKVMGYASGKIVQMYLDLQVDVPCSTQLPVLLRGGVHDHRIRYVLRVLFRCDQRSSEFGRFWNHHRRRRRDGSLRCGMDLVLLGSTRIDVY